MLRFRVLKWENKHERLLGKNLEESKCGLLEGIGIHLERLRNMQKLSRNAVETFQLHMTTDHKENKGDERSINSKCHIHCCIYIDVTSREKHRWGVFENRVPRLFTRYY
jgi:hypothetical protein